LILISTLVLTVSAAPSRVIDDAGLLDWEEIQSLETYSESLYNTYGLDIVFLTVDSLDGSSSRDYADDYYDYGGYGSDGVLFLLAMAEREWYISTSGDAVWMLSDSDLMALEDEIIPYLSSGRYYDAFDHFQSQLAECLETESPADIYYDSQGNLYAVYQEEYPKVNWFISLFAGAVIALIVIVIMRSSMTTRRAQRAAANYQTRNSYRLKTHQDLFLYSNITKRAIPQNTGNGGTGGTGGVRSTVHHSSSGRSHGGRGGKF